MQHHDHARRCLLPLVLALAAAVGCSTLTSKGPTLEDEYPNEQTGNAFSGVWLNLQSAYCLPRMAAGAGSFQRWLILSFGTVELLVDFPLSLAADLIVAPVDLLSEADPPRPHLFEPPCAGVNAFIIPGSAAGD